MNKDKTYIEYKCPICNEKFEISLYQLERKKTPYCKRCVTIGTQKGVKRPQFSGINSGRWKGGKYVSTDGYRTVKAEGENHPSGRQKYKKEHIIVYEEFLGRELKTQNGNMGEQIHHIDGNKLNNGISNLEYCKDTREHRNFHCQLEKIAFDLVRKEVIIYDKETKEYKINESRIT